MVNYYNYDLYADTVMDIVSNGITVDSEVMAEECGSASEIIKDSYDKGLKPFDAAISLLQSYALAYWCYLAVGEHSNVHSDAEVNDLLEKVAGSDYDYECTEEEGAIYCSIMRLDYDRLRAFIKGCIAIKETL